MQLPEPWLALASPRALASQKVSDFKKNQKPNLLENDPNTTRNNISKQKQKEQKYKFVELLIPTLSKIISDQF